MNSRPSSDKVGSTTSAEAGARTDAERDETRVYRALVAAGPQGLTDEEIATQLHLGGNTARPRRVALLDRGQVRWSGRTRPTVRGRAANVWIAAARPPWEQEAADRREPVPCAHCRGSGCEGYRDRTGQEVVGIEVKGVTLTGIEIRGRYGDQRGEWTILHDAAALFTWLDQMGQYATHSGLILGWWAPVDTVALQAIQEMPALLRVLSRLPQLVRGT